MAALSAAAVFSSALISVSDIFEWLVIIGSVRHAHLKCKQHLFFPVCIL